MRVGGQCKPARQRLTQHNTPSVDRSGGTFPATGKRCAGAVTVCKPCATPLSLPSRCFNVTCSLLCPQQVKLRSGKVIKGGFADTATLADVRDWVAAASGMSAFTLSSTFPACEYATKGQLESSLKAAGKGWWRWPPHHPPHLVVVARVALATDPAATLHCVCMCLP